MRILLSLSLLTLVSCGQAELAKSVKAIDGVDGKSCLLEDSMLTCGDQKYDLSANGDWTFTKNPDGSVTISRPGNPDLIIGENLGEDDPNQNLGFAQNQKCQFERDPDGKIYTVCNGRRMLILVPR